MFKEGGPCKQHKFEFKKLWAFVTFAADLLGVFWQQYFTSSAAITLDEIVC